MKDAVQVQLPQELVAQAQSFVEARWAADFDALLTESVRRYPASHSGKFAEAFVREDKWGLHGCD